MLQSSSQLWQESLHVPVRRKRSSCSFRFVEQWADWQTFNQWLDLSCVHAMLGHPRHPLRTSCPSFEQKTLHILISQLTIPESGGGGIKTNTRVLLGGKWQVKFTVSTGKGYFAISVADITPSLSPTENVLCFVFLSTVDLSWKINK